MRAGQSYDLIQLAAVRLDDLTEEVVFVGGASVALLITDTVSRAPRVTLDVDVVVEVATRHDYNQLESRLRKLGFQNDFGGPICRFCHGELTLDVMPTDPDILGFSNAWYAEAVSHAQAMTLQNGKRIRVSTAPCIVATKLEAFESPHRENARDFLASRDFEDLVTLFDGRPELVEEISNATPRVRDYIASTLRSYREMGVLGEGISAHLQADEQSRLPRILDRMHEAADL